MPKKSRASQSADPQATTHSTKDRIIDAAEMLFSQQGYEGTTTRAIAMKADVPLGLMSYYFGTKSDLYSEVITRRSAEHAADIEASLKAVAERGDFTIAELIEAFVMPPIRRALDGGPGWAAYIKLLSLAANTPDSEPHTKTFARQYAKVVDDFVVMLRRKMPGASEEDVYWAYYILNSAFIHVLVENASIDKLSGGRCKASDLETVAAKMAMIFDAGISRLAAR